MSTRQRKPAPRAATVPLWIIQVFGMFCVAGLLGYGFAFNHGRQDTGALTICAGLVLLTGGVREGLDLLAGLRRGDDQPDA